MPLKFLWLPSTVNSVFEKDDNNDEDKKEEEEEVHKRGWVYRLIKIWKVNMQQMLGRRQGLSTKHVKSWRVWRGIPNDRQKGVADEAPMITYVNVLAVLEGRTIQA